MKALPGPLRNIEQNKPTMITSEPKIVGVGNQTASTCFRLRQFMIALNTSIPIKQISANKTLGVKRFWMPVVELIDQNIFCQISKSC